MPNVLGNLILLRGNWFSLTELVLNNISSSSFLEEMLNLVREGIKIVLCSTETSMQENSE